MQPPSGGCVLKPPELRQSLACIAAAFGRLCVETYTPRVIFKFYEYSRLRAAVC